MLIGATVIVGAGLLVVVTVVIRIAWFARRLAAEIASLTTTAGGLAGEQLPKVVTALRNSEQLPRDATRLPDMKITEIATAATAIAGLYEAAVAATVAEAGLRNGFRQILVSLGRRNQSLLHRQLRIIDGLEQQAVNPAALADLFTLDHLTTRMRRHAESLTILSGAAAGRTWSGPVPVIDVMRAATAEVEDYTRVTVITDSEEAVTAPAVTDMIHLLAELIENATLFSPSTTRVEVRAERVANGFAIEIEERGLGIPPDQLIHINAQLAHPPDFDMADADRLGLFVAGRLAARHGVHVALTQSAYRGTKAVVVLPDTIVVPPMDSAAAARSAELATSRAARLDLRSPEVLSLAGAVLASSPAADREYDRAEPDTPARNAIGTIGAADARGQRLGSTTIHGLPRRIRPGATGATPAAQDATPGIPGAPGAPDAPAGAERPADGSGGLPRRHVPPEGPAPEHARTLAASLQNSWQRSRRDDHVPESAPESEES